jgi:hypothetical protein
VCNGGLIDFQDTRMMFGDGNAYGIPAVANMAAYTTQASYPGYTMVQAMPGGPGVPGVQGMMPAVPGVQGMMPGGPGMASQGMMPVGPSMPGVQGMMPMPHTNGPIVLGPPSELYANGQVYKLASTETAASVSEPSVASNVKQPSDKELRQRVNQKVEEYFSNTRKPVTNSRASTKSSFLQELNKLNASMGKKSKK